MPTIATVWPGRDVAAAKNVHGAAERLARERLVGERGGEGHHGLGRGDVVFGIGLVRERRDAFADAQPLDAVAERVDRAPGLVPEGARLGRERHPVRPGPGRQVRGAHPAALQPQAHLPGAGHRARHLVDAHPPGPGEDRRPHRAGRSAHDAMPPTLVCFVTRALTLLRTMHIPALRRRRTVACARQCCRLRRPRGPGKGTQSHA